MHGIVPGGACGRGFPAAASRHASGTMTQQRWTHFKRESADALEVKLESFSHPGFDELLTLFLTPS